LIDDLPNVRFELAGAEAIPADDETYDIVFMFKSLHHVPLTLMDQALQEITRVLRPGGLAYISEPIFKGDFNDLLRLFHDEESARKAAFTAVKNAVDTGLLSLVKEVFFNTPMFFKNFEEFESKVIKVTHTNHQLKGDVYEKTRQQFSLNMRPDGAHFLLPIRVDLLKRIA